MITIFRKIRQKLIDSGSVTKYLLYAIGEILLVVFGILLALQINNWNEERKLDKTTRVLLKQIQLDLVENIEISNNVIKEYQEKDSVFWVMRNRELQPSDFMGSEGRRWKREINTYTPINLINNGYPKLMEHPGVRPGEQTEILDLLKLLDDRRSRAERNSAGIVEFRDTHMKYRNKNYEWKITSYWEGTVNEEDEARFYTNDRELKLYVAEYADKYMRYVTRISEYIQFAIPAYELIQEELREPRSEIPELIRDYYIELPEDSLYKFTGSYSAHYIPPLHQIGNFNTVDSIQIYLDTEKKPGIKFFRAGEELGKQTLKIRSLNKLEGEGRGQIEFILNGDGDIEIKEIVGVNYIFKRKE